MNNVITVLQIALPIVIIILILLQERSAGLSSLWGGDGGGFYQTRRGFERWIFIATIVCAVLLATVSVWRLIP
ncbi:MAG TPA: preprotein translocase subunit SecG [Candidatus Paceibacterota bacterium]